jgi:diaminopimelate decarboxylase
MSSEESGPSNDANFPAIDVALLPQEELQAFVAHYFSRGKIYLNVLKETPPPAYLLETQVLEQKARQFQQAFRNAFSQVSFYYACKSNNCPEVAKVLLRTGFGLDVSSGLELSTGLSLGARDMVFSGPGKTDHELRLAVDHAERVAVLLDSFSELQRLEDIAKGKGATMRAGVRLTTINNGIWRKFGIIPQDLQAFWEKACACPHVNLQGMQFHTSWNLTPKAQIDFIRLLGNVLRDMPEEFKKSMEFLDIGGGYWPPQGEWLHAAGTEAGRTRVALGQPACPDTHHYRLASNPIEMFAEAIGSAIQEHISRWLSCRICLEPGRWICNDAMHLVFSVVDKKAPDLVITDAGTNAIGWERFETDYFPILNLTRPNLTEKPCDVLGSLCTPHDVWGYSYWGEDIRPGDILMIPTQGAYTYSLRQNFIKPLPSLILL